MSIRIAITMMSWYRSRMARKLLLDTTVDELAVEDKDDKTLKLEVGGVVNTISRGF